MIRGFFSLIVFCSFIRAPMIASAITIPTVPVGDAGNPNDPSTANRYGSVGYAYRMGTTEVTNDQYVAFLNAKAQIDQYQLYSPNMSFSILGGITRSGTIGSFSYAVKPDFGDKPVNWVNWYDAARFVNWLNNGQGDGDTETGAYTLLGSLEVPDNYSSITRNAGATWFLPTESEWYKAGYYQPSANGGDSDSYWAYPTQSNAPPIVATAINASGPTRGDIANPGAGVANYKGGAVWNGNSRGNVTSVGSAGPLSNSYYGTADQAGNVDEWIETLFDGGFRGVRGGSYLDTDVSYLTDYNTLAWSEGNNVGFRVASIPEPSTGVLALLTLGFIWAFRKPLKNR